MDSEEWLDHDLTGSMVVNSLPGSGQFPHAYVLTKIADASL